MEERDLKKMLEIGERYFGTARDPNQMPVSMESFHKLQTLHPKTVIYRKENGEPVSWVVVVPTSSELADKFMKGEITERELLDLSEPSDAYEALYLCAAFTVPEYRRRGYVVAMLKEAIKSIPHVPNVRVFAWPYSEEGKAVTKKLGAQLGILIELKK